MLPPLISLDELHDHKLASAAGVHEIHHDSFVGALLIRLSPPTPRDCAIYFLDNELALVFEIETLEVVGFYIESPTFRA